MATKKFTIPSLAEMEKSKTGEYKVKSLFDKHRSPKKITDDTGKPDTGTTAKEGKSFTNVQSNGGKTSSEGRSSNAAASEASGKTNASVLQTTQPAVKSSSLGSLAPKKPSGLETKVDVRLSRDSQKDAQASNSSKPLQHQTLQASPKKTTTAAAVVTLSPPRPAQAAVGVLKTAGISPSKPVKTTNLIVSSRQRGNPLLKHIRNVPWEFSDIVADYEMGTVMCALFLSLRYHSLHPDYIHERLKLLGHSYDLRVLLVQVDTKDPHHALQELSHICILADCTLMCAWSPEEAARYLETYKMFERKPPDMLMEKQEVDYVSRAQDVLTSGRKVNRTDVLTLLSTFHSFEGVVGAGEDELSFCPGLGAHKAKRLHTLLHEPFLKAKKPKHQEQTTE